MSALGNTPSLSRSELSEYRYQPGHTGKESIYLIGDDYFCASKSPPKYPVLGHEWTKHSDQFWAERAGTIIWRITMD